jgi:hypothetical protein
MFQLSLSGAEVERNSGSTQNHAHQHVFVCEVFTKDVVNAV